MKIRSQLVLKDVCAWPNMIRLPGDQIGAVIFNRPSHGLEEGSLELWSCNTTDFHWQHLGTPCPNIPGQNRMHCSCGVGKTGKIHILSTGFSITNGQFLRLEPLWHSRSIDGGKTWKISKDVKIEGIEDSIIPHGSIVYDDTGSLFSTVYRSYGKDNLSYTWLIQSSNTGRSWQKHSLIGSGDTNEAYLLASDPKWLAAVRTHKDHHTRLFSCESDKSIWQDNGPLTLPMQHPGHLLAIGKKGVLLTFGIRNRGLMAIAGRFSPNHGQSWHAPFILHQFPESASDCGYPSTIAIDNNNFITGYYTNASKEYEGYQFGVLFWKLSEILSPRELLSISDGQHMQL